MDSNYSLSDLKAVTENDGFMGGNSWLVLILFFLFFGMNGWGNGNFNNRGVASPEDVFLSNNQQSVFNCLSGIKEAVTTGSYDTARLVDGVNYHNMQNTNAIQQTLNTGFDGIAAQLNNLGFQMSQCCCDLKTQMLQDKYDDVRYQLEQANTAVANAVQTQNILGQLGRYYAYPAVNPYTCYSGNLNGYNFNGTTLA